MFSNISALLAILIESDALTILSSTLNNVMSLITGIVIICNIDRKVGVESISFDLAISNGKPLLSMITPIPE